MTHRAVAEERGSISIEASISLTLFILAMVGLLLFIRISRIQASIQYSLNMAALEMSQYTYLYYATGLYDLEQNIRESGSSSADVLIDATERLDQSALGIETIFQAMSNGTQSAVDQFQQRSVDGVYDAIREQAEQMSEEGKNIAEQIDGLKGLVSNVKGDPIAFVRSLAALATSTGLDAAKGRLLGSLYGRSLCEAYIGNGQDADLWLQNMGIKGGLSGLNFNWSSMMSGQTGEGAKDPSQDIDLVVTYEVIVFPGLYDDLTIQFAQSASTRAWLGGDAHIKRFEPLPAASNPPGTEPETSPTPEPTPEATSANLWSETNNLRKGAMMKELVASEYSGVGFVSENSGFYGYRTEGAQQTFYTCSAMDILAPSYQRDSAIKSSIKSRGNAALEKILHTMQIQTDDGQTHIIDGTTPSSLELLVVIPENAQNRRDAVQVQADLAAQELNQNYAGQGHPLSISIRVVTGGGASSQSESEEDIS